MQAFQLFLNKICADVDFSRENLTMNGVGTSDEDEFEFDDLDFDMWDGQFEFVGPNVKDFKMRTYSEFNGFKRNDGLNGDDLAFQVLQQQVGVLQDTANQNDERYTRAKADNASLQARVLMLEEQIRETELRYEEKLQDEQRRTKELVSRLEREKQLLLENASIRLQSSEAECLNLKEEVARQRTQLEKFENQRQNLMDQTQDITSELNLAKEEIKKMKDQEIRLKREYEAQVQLSEELLVEIEQLRAEARTPALPTTSPETLRLEELHEEISSLRTENSQLKETTDDLQATLLHARLESNKILNMGETSLAAEFEVMSHDEVHQALREQQEVNRQLRTYIEGILLNIVENHPQLLEVKHRPV
ncbi:rab11 family-interacting protein nuf isoform X3 [Leptinotarsa decemlineata]|uniref:rab11 family-interacting protein nuf isoform X3 n=1 Tax=Leptinotarsa decemlineata TaxID=7539 RepID=UPI003D30D57A